MNGRRLFVLFSLAFLNATWAHASEKLPASDEARHVVIRQMADDLLRGLNPQNHPSNEQQSLTEKLKKSAWELKQWWNEDTAQNPNRKRKIAIWPFWRDKSAVSEDFAEMLSDSLLAELLRNRRPQDEYVAREDLKIVIQDIDDFNQLRTSSEKITKLIRNAGADILIIGEVKPGSNGQSVNIRYRATNVSTGAIPATTDWYRLAYDFDRTPTIGAAEAIKQSAAYFRNRLDSIRTIRPQGIRYGDSGIQSAFGRWFSSRLIAELRQQATAAGQEFNVADAEISEKNTQMRGLKLARKSADQEMAATPTSDYVLSGKYWLLGRKVDLQLSLKDGSGKIFTWQGDIRTSSIDLPIKPAQTYIAERESDNLGPISLRIRSNKGADPVYTVGQKMVLFIEVSRDSYLYCFYRQSDGSIMRIFPNRLHKSAFIAGNVDQHIPSAAMAFDWIVQEPTGIEIMKCFAFDRDITDELPKLVRKLDFEPLPYRTLAALGSDLRSIRRVAIAENSMVVNVEK